GYDIKEMKEIFNDSDETVLEVHEKDVDLGDLEVGDTVETRGLQSLVTDLFQNNYLSRQKPDFPFSNKVFFCNDL
ncbi:unnamed protein product, partial [Diamesa serratosioi]